ncbi:2-dehydropantoate 2-reductase [Neosynechococcus sphagnicola sy1]|uniref:2-dehydropantoate 2-reductase n=1 Tax=Neosynechococcus sphagnicola sy1 TaxID=1497020 RepID=A0A098TKZ8_9CYAN|nr:putative 2-dehydropantoate 2-reductase [Neosynechococcus sphagnicola]KGF72964.1 2-dehydropantoate 2-reductase [Neosynechococcus sphagnicola sy1]
MTTYAILGTGALGGFYGARLQQAGNTVHFLLHSDYAHVKRQGLVIESPAGNFTLPQVNAYADVGEMPPCDVVVVALKSTQNHLLPQLLPPVLQETGVVLLLQNGLDVEKAVATIVGDQRVMSGLCFICSNKVGPGHIRHLDYGAIILGDYAPGYPSLGITARMQRVAQDFTQAGIDVELATDLLLARWRKLVWNIPFNGLSVVLDAKVDALITDSHTHQLATDLMQEVVAIAARQGREIPEAYIQGMLKATTQMKPYLTSMKIDYDQGRPMEIEALFGNPLRVAQVTGVSVPKLEMLYQQLLFLDRQQG